FVCGPGFFYPFEQATSRAIAARRVRGEGGRPIVARAAIAGGGVAAGTILAVAIFAGPLDKMVLGGDPALLAALILGLAAYCLHFLARGTLAGNTRFRPYGLLPGRAGVLRVMRGV